MKERLEKALRRLFKFDYQHDGTPHGWTLEIGPGWFFVLVFVFWGLVWSLL